jgi:hypothetical protein
VGRRVLAVVVVLGLSLGASACSQGWTPSALESWPEQPSCGSYENRNEPVSVEQRRKNQCLLDALAEGRRAKLVVTYATVEGDPITEYYRILGPDRAEVFIDATADSYGTKRWTHHVCDSVEEDSGFLYGVDCRAISVDEIVS